MSYCDELPFGIISSNSYLNIETMNIIYFYDYYECTDDIDYINDYDGVEDYYADYYVNIDDVSLMVDIVNCKKNHRNLLWIIIKYFNHLKHRILFFHCHSLIVYVMHNYVFISCNPINTFINLCVFNLQETADLVTFTGEVLNGKPHFLCSAML